MEPMDRSANRVLVVAGEAATRGFIKRTLESVLLEVETASRLESALPKLTSGEYGLIVLDPPSPSVDGVDLLEELHRQDPSLARRTIILVEPGSPIVEHLRSFPNCRIIDRPVMRNQLILAVSECLREVGARS
ncbi:MAG TPA: response regulator [Thermoanaerobaculia bacterium]